jgi:hypothetical protein
MGAKVRSALAILLLAVPIFAQSDEFRVYTDTPRLLLTRSRLRLLQRERERQTMRWQQFDALVTGGAPMPEPGFAWGLYYRVSGQESWGKQAVDWALSDKAVANKPADLRQLALVFDWCAPLMTEMQIDRLSAKLQRALAGASANPDVAQQSARALAAIALADQLPDHGESILKPLVAQWWRDDIAKRLRTGEPAVPREQFYPLLELLHAVRDNLKIDLREDAAEYFESLPTDHVMGHYPAPFPAPENEYRIPVYVRDGEPDLADAAYSRAAGLAMVAFDTNAPETQFLQGWLMQDRFLMRGALGAPYEFLWANPYQPGLSYDQLPLIYHSQVTGHVFARTSWDEDATWLGYFDGHLQLYRDGKIQTLKPGTATGPVHVGSAVILSARDPSAARFRADAETVFILALAPHTLYDVEIDDQELREEETDVGGTLILSFPQGIETGIRIRRQAD